MIQTQAEIEKLAESFKQPSEVKTEKYIRNLKRMQEFYSSKIEVAPDNQAIMFGHFVKSLECAIATFHMYRHVTERLAKLAGGDHADRTDS